MLKNIKSYNEVLYISVLCTSVILINAMTDYGEKEMKEFCRVSLWQ